MKKLLLVYLAVMSCALAATRTEKIRNDRVIAYEETLAPAETESSTEGLPNVTVFLTDGRVTGIAEDGRTTTMVVKRGEVIFRGAKAGPLRVTGTTEMRFVRVEFLGKASAETWGTAGFAPDYRMLFENGYVRTYNIQMAAGHSEPQHSHHERVVVALSGADLRHVLPDGHQEDSSLKTGDVLFRPASTHIGKNIGKTDLWVIAIEPK
jgi:hypothetical protein